MKLETTVAADGLQNIYHQICIKLTGKTHSYKPNCGLSGLLGTFYCLLFAIPKYNVKD